MIVIDTRTFQNLDKITGLSGAHDVFREWLADEGVDLTKILVDQIDIDPFFVHFWTVELVTDDNGVVRLDPETQSPPKRRVHRLVTVDPPEFLCNFPVSVVWSVPAVPAFHTITEAIFIMSNINVTDSTPNVQVSAKFLDQAKNVVPPDDIPQWASSDETVAKLSSSTVDGVTSLFSIPGIAGASTVTCTSINKEGVKIVLSGTITVTPGDAVQGELDFVDPTAVVPVVPAPATEPPATAAAETPAPVTEPAPVTAPVITEAPVPVTAAA